MSRLPACFMLLPPHPANGRAPRGQLTHLRPIRRKSTVSWHKGVQWEPGRGQEGGLLTLVHRGRVMLVLAANRHLNIWPNWQLDPMTACSRTYSLWHSFSNVTGAKKEILGKSLEQRTTISWSRASCGGRGLTTPVVQISHLKCTTRIATIAQQHKKLKSGKKCFIFQDINWSCQLPSFLHKWWPRN